jgi:transposase
VGLPTGRGDYGRNGRALFASPSQAAPILANAAARRPDYRGGHYLVEPVACTPASGWEKGQIENQVGFVRERFFTPRLRFKSYDELNAWLLDKCVAYAKAHRHPEIAGKTVWEVFEKERPKIAMRSCVSN